MYAWIKFKCCKQIIGHGCFLFDDSTRIKYLLEGIFWLVGICMCYFTIIIFFSDPYLFDIIGKPVEQNGFYLLTIINLFIISLVCVVARIQKGLSKRASFVYKLAMYILTIILSNILSLLTFKYLTITIRALTAPLLGFTLALITLEFLILLHNLIELLKICFKCSSEINTNIERQDTIYL